MQIHLQISHDHLSVDETFVGANAEEVVGKMKARVAKESSFTVRLVINTLSNLAFAQEVVKRYNQAQKLNLPIPNSSSEFIQLAIDQGFATVQKE